MSGVSLCILVGMTTPPTAVAFLEALPTEECSIILLDTERITLGETDTQQLERQSRARAAKIVEGLAEILTTEGYISVPKPHNSAGTMDFHNLYGNRLKVINGFPRNYISYQEIHKAFFFTYELAILVVNDNERDLKEALESAYVTQFQGSRGRQAWTEAGNVLARLNP